jgi:carboxyl-terminal processing protease
MRILSAILLLLLPSAASAASIRCAHLPMLFQVFFREHYSIKEMSEKLKVDTVEQFIKNVDPSKTLLLEQDVARLRKELTPLFGTMTTGDCGALEAAGKLLIERAKEDEDYVRELLKGDYQVDESVELVLDPEKRGYARTAAERKELVRKLVNFQLSNYLIAQTKLPAARKQLVHHYELVSKRLAERRAKDDLLVNYAEAFALAMDPHSSYMSQEALEDFQIQMRLSLEGIGASLTSQDGFTVIEDLIPGGSADRLKILKPKDKIIAVAQDGAKSVQVMDMDLREVVRMIRGKKGTKVTLTILREGETTETFNVTIVRDKIDIQEQAAKITYETRKSGDRELRIAIIELPSFYGGEKGNRSSYGDVKKLLEEAVKEKADGVVLNLSRNGGGLLEDAVRISGLFIRKGAVVATRDSNRNVEVLDDKDEEIVYPGPVVVYTSRLSASASEILAGALRDYRRAVVIGGDHTFGKGTVQVLSPLPFNLGAMKVTKGMFFLPGGKSTQHDGVPSDIVLPSGLSNDSLGEKTMDHSLPPQSIPAFLSKDVNADEEPRRWKPVDPSVVRKLAAKSRERVEKDPRFAEIRKEIDEAAKNKGPVKLAEIRRKAEKTEKKTGNSAGKKEREQRLKDAEAPYLNESVNVMVDLIAALGA